MTAKEYLEKGIAAYDKGDFDAAIADYSQVIELDPNNVEAYKNRGWAKSDLSDYQGAIADYSKAIEIDPNYAAAYNGRGYAKSDLSDYEGAIADFSQAIKLDPNLAAAYYNRGIAKYDLSDYKGAIADFSQAIKLDPNLAAAYNGRSNAYILNEEYNLAADDFIKAKTDILRIVELKNGEEVAKKMLDDGCGDTPFFKEAIGNVTEKKEDYKNIYIQSLKIVSKLMLDYTNEMPVSHYTKTAIAERMLVGDFKEVTARSALRISSLNTSNDSSEGKILYQYLFDNQKEDKQIEDYGASAGCFAFNNDSLNQFRLYGKTDDKEATGVSIAVNEKIFSKSITTPLQMQSDTGNKPDKEKKSPELLPLFRYIYIDPETNSVVSLGQKEKYVFLKEGKSANTYKKCKEKIDNTQKEISQELETLKEMARDLNKDIVHKLLLNLRYLIKHVAFKEEQECRIIKVAKLTGSTIKPSENNSLYIDYSEFKPDNVEKICFGRKAKEIDRFKQHLARNRYSQTECYQSKAPLI